MCCEKGRKLMRSKSRECAFKIIFASLFHDADDGAFRRSVYKAAELGEEEAAFAETLVSAVRTHRGELEERLGRYAVGFSAERLFPADKSALCLAMAEVLYVGTPAVVAVDEAVGLAKKYSTEKSVGFVNGVLAGFLAEEVQK